MPTLKDPQDIVNEGGEHMTTVVRATEITKEFRTGKVVVHALRGVSLEIEAGEMVAIVGPSGSGKSTLLGLLGGLDTPTSGRVEVDSLDITDMNEGQLADVRSAKIGFVFQTFNLIPTLTALENVALPAQFARSRGKVKPTRRARDLLTTVGLGDRLKHRPAELSGGEQQRVALARAMVNQPALILADEPTGNLDSASGERVLEALEQMRRETGTTLVVVTHDPSVAARADRVLQLHDGQIVQ
jgi:putative ABC transport system ATP-binding protein